MEDEVKNREELVTNNETKDETKDNQGSGSGAENNNIDVTKVKADAVSEYLKGIGYDETALKQIIAKHEEEEEKGKTDLEKVQGQLKKVTQMLAEERKERMLSDAKLAALKLGAKKDLVDDLVTVAMSRVTKEKDINSVVSEMKAGVTGSVYFESSEEEQEKQKRKNLTGGMIRKSGVEQNKKSESSGDPIMDRIRENRERKEKKKRYFSK